MRNKNVVFCDLDGTLIETLNGTPFPKGIWDMKLKIETWKALKKHFDAVTKEKEPCFLFIVSNQGGIERGLLSVSTFEYKIGYIKEALQGFLGRKVMVDFSYASSNQPSDPLRKPNAGMFHNLVKKWRVWLSSVPKSSYLMIGDASGKPGQFSDSDFMSAQEFGIDYFDIADFILHYQQKKR